MADMSPYCYEYPHPALTTDIILFTLRHDVLSILLIRRRAQPFQGSWALPGGFVDMDECLEDCALRELAEETGITGVYLEQLYTFGKPNRDPRERVISVAYYALAAYDQLAPVAGSDAAEVAWFALDDLPPLAFDHADVIQLAQQRLRAKLDYSTVAFGLVGETFTLGELQKVYEIIRGEALDKRNFRKHILSLGVLAETDATRSNGKSRPAKLYRLAHPGAVQYIK
ncbi:MAG: NUDIX hydrolase [Sulfuriferula sp.]|nr:NUDIX hydrolase [Sulfuriferula sp.]